MIQIEEVIIFGDKVATQLSWSTVIDDTSETANVYYKLAQANHEVIFNNTVQMDKGDYAAWAEDNDYVTNWLLTELNLTKK